MLVYSLFCICCSITITCLYRDRNKTFRPKHKFKKGTVQYDLHKYVKDTLGSGELSTAVQLPPGEDLNEWLAINSV